MQPIEQFSDLGKRIEAIGLEWKHLARLAGVSPSTVWRAVSGKSDSRSSTIRKINEALLSEEARVRKHFAQLDGKAPNKTEQAA